VDVVTVGSNKVGFSVFLREKNKVSFVALFRQKGIKLVFQSFETKQKTTDVAPMVL